MKYNNIFLAIITSSTVAMSLSNWAAPSYAQSEESANIPDTLIISEVPSNTDWGHPSEHGPWHNKLGLSDEQMEQLVSLKSEYAVNTARQKAELKADKKKMMLLMTQPTVDKQAILSLNEKMKSLKSDLSDARVNHMVSAMNVMTPKQREQMRHHMLAHSLSHHRMGHNKHHSGPSHQHHTA